MNQPIPILKKVAEGIVVNTGKVRLPNGNVVNAPNRKDGTSLECYSEAEAAALGFEILPSDNEMTGRGRIIEERTYAGKVNFKVDMTEETLPAGSIYWRMLGLNEVLKSIANPADITSNTEDVQSKVAVTELQLITGVNGMDWLDKLTNTKKVRIKKLYATSKAGTFEDILPELYVFDAEGKRVNSPTDKKYFRDRSKDENNNTVHHIDNLNVLLDGFTALRIAVQQGDVVTFRFDYEIVI